MFFNNQPRRKLIPQGQSTKQQQHELKGHPSRTRTCGPWVKSPLLYQLSYRMICGYLGVVW